MKQNTSAMKQGYTKYQCNEANKAKQHADTKYSKYSPDKICVQSSRNRWVQPRTPNVRNIGNEPQ